MSACCLDPFTIQIDWLYRVEDKTLGLAIVPLNVNMEKDFLQCLLETTEAGYNLTMQKRYPVSLFDAMQKIYLLAVERQICFI